MDDKSALPWLVTLAHQVDTMILKPGAMERWRAKLLEWSEAREQRYADSTYCDPLLPPPAGMAYTTLDAYAVCAAVHDAVNANHELPRLIDPWGDDGSSAGAIAYAVLVKNVGRVIDDHRERLEQALNEVAEDEPATIAVQPVNGTIEAKSGAGRPTTPALDDQDYDILRLMTKATALLKQGTIEARLTAARTPLSEKTISAKLAYMEQEQLVERPKGKRKGYRVTDRGREILAAHAGGQLTV